MTAQLRAHKRDFMRRLRGHPPQAWMVRRGLTLGKDVYINETASLDPDFLWLISIGDSSVIANAVQIVAHDGSTRLWNGYIRIGRVDIGRRVYVGAGSIILPGVTVGDDAIIGAGSVVRRDVPRGAVMVGNPAAQMTTIEEFAERHRARLRQRPSYPSAGFSGYDEPTPANIERMRRELMRGGGYVE